MLTSKEKQNIPEGWVSKPLGDLGVLIMGQSPRGSSYSKDDEGTPLLNGAVELKKDGIFVHQYTTAPTRLCSKGNLLFCIRATIGNLQKADKEYCLGRGVAALDVNNDYSWEYVAQQLEVLFTLMRRRSQGGVIKGLKKDEIAEFEILLPEAKKEQRKIAKVLGSVDEEIEKTKEVIKATEKLKKGLMQKLFTRGIGHKQFKQTELGEIPEGWNVESFTAVTNESKDRNDDERLSSDAIMGVNKLLGLIPMKERIKGKDTKRYKIVREKDFSYNPMRLNIGSIARNETSESVLVSPDYIVFSCNTDLVIPDYVNHFIQSYAWKNYIKRSGDGSVRVRIYFDHLSGLKVPVPGIEEQNKITEIFSAVDEKISVNKKLLSKQTELKKGLMQDLLSGNKRVNV